MRAELLVFLQGGQAIQDVSLMLRQRTTLALLGDSATSREIARKLGIDPETAKLHVAAILKRLGASNRTGAVAAARRISLS